MDKGHVTQSRHRRQSRQIVGLALPPGAGCPPTGPQRLAHLNLGVAAIQQADGQADALLEDLLVLGAGEARSHTSLVAPSVQPALGGCNAEFSLGPGLEAGNSLREERGGRGRKGLG